MKTNRKKIGEEETTKIDEAIPSSKIQKKFGEYLAQSEVKPVVVSCGVRLAAVLVSWKEYQRLRELDDEHWVRLAKEAMDEGHLNDDELEGWLIERFGPYTASRIEIEMSKSAFKFLKVVRDTQFAKIIGAVRRSDRDSSKIANHPFHLIDVDNVRVVYEYVGDCPSLIYIGRLHHVHK